MRLVKVWFYQARCRLKEIDFERDSELLLEAHTINSKLMGFRLYRLLINLESILKSLKTKLPGGTITFWISLFDIYHPKQSVFKSISLFCVAVLLALSVLHPFHVFIIALETLLFINGVHFVHTLCSYSIGKSLLQIMNESWPKYNFYKWSTIPYPLFPKWDHLCDRDVTTAIDPRSQRRKYELYDILDYLPSPRTRERFSRLSRDEISNKNHLYRLWYSIERSLIFDRKGEPARWTMIDNVLSSKLKECLNTKRRLLVGILIQSILYYLLLSDVIYFGMGSLSWLFLVCETIRIFFTWVYKYMYVGGCWEYYGYLSRQRRILTDIKKGLNDPLCNSSVSEIIYLSEETIDEPAVKNDIPLSENDSQFAIWSRRRGCFGLVTITGSAITERFPLDKREYVEIYHPKIVKALGEARSLSTRYPDYVSWTNPVMRNVVLASVGYRNGRVVDHLTPGHRGVDSSVEKETNRLMFFLTTSLLHYEYYRNLIINLSRDHRRIKLSTFNGLSFLNALGILLVTNDWQSFF